MYYGRDGDAKALLKAGADPNLRDNYGITPLMYAAVHAWPETVKLLLAHGADPHIRNWDGHDTIYFIQQSLKSKSHKEMQQRLLENQQIIENAMK
jgi:ankyrin repeat protein